MLRCALEDMKLADRSRLCKLNVQFWHDPISISSNLLNCLSQNADFVIETLPLPGPNNHLALVLRARLEQGDDREGFIRSEAEALETQVKTFTQTLVGQWTAEKLQKEDVRMLDYISPLWSGHPSLNGGEPFPVTPLVTQIVDLF